MQHCGEFVVTVLLSSEYRFQWCIRNQLPVGLASLAGPSSYPFGIVEVAAVVVVEMTVALTAALIVMVLIVAALVAAAWLIAVLVVVVQIAADALNVA